ncbi:hypothetical protein Mgra_00003085 [Meloidogyne graminicola]|uniref:Uncharacterized protein n=1 Tax=Meloidogyne graminicola TaxID=189291 RepID=A0A8S9ZWQ9_9BILA|nr:hypothetical protein Mgra_00003085 [Meloidogyne graminicola]
MYYINVVHTIITSIIYLGHLLCEKANRIKRSLDIILIIPNYRYYEELGNLGKQLRFSYIEKNGICNEINEDIYNWMVFDIMNKYIRNINDDLRPKLLKKLNDYMEESVNENIKILNDYTTAKINIEQLRYTTLGNDNIEHIKNYINKEHLKPIGCEITIAASQICLQGDYLNCHRIRPALSFLRLIFLLQQLWRMVLMILLENGLLPFFLEYKNLKLSRLLKINSHKLIPKT